MKLSRLSRRGVLGIVLGLTLAASVAFAATLAVTSAGITTHSGSASVPPTTCTVAPSADAPLPRDFATTNLGAYEFMSVRSLNNSQRRAIVRFNIASCAIPANAAVRTSVLTFNVTTPPGTSRTYGAHRVTAGWNEGTVTWNNQPAFAATATSSIATGTAPSSLSWSVVSDVSAFVAGSLTNNGWTLRDAVENAGGGGIETGFGTKENPDPATHPVLTITFYP